jgi:hypothetical protein
MLSGDRMRGSAILVCVRRSLLPNYVLCALALPWASPLAHCFSLPGSGSARAWIFGGPGRIRNGARRDSGRSRIWARMTWGGRPVQRGRLAGRQAARVGALAQAPVVAGAVERPRAMPGPSSPCSSWMHSMSHRCPVCASSTSKTSRSSPRRTGRAFSGSRCRIPSVSRCSGQGSWLAYSARPNARR